MKHKIPYSLSVLFLALVSGVSLSLAVENTAPGPVTDWAGKYCVEGKDGKGLQLLEAIPNADKSIDFGVSVWFESGQNCGVTGTAKPTKDGWRYEAGLDSKNKDDHCAIDFKATEGGITVNADPKAPCASTCGGGSSITNVIFAESSREKKAVEKKELEPETFFNTSCAPAK